MDVRPVRDEASYDWALAEISRYFESPPLQGTPESDRFDVLASLIAAYEAKAHPIPHADAIDVLRFSMEQNRRSQSDLAAVIGSRSRASELLAGRRALTLDMIRKISLAWHIPAGALISTALAA